MASRAAPRETSTTKRLLGTDIENYDIEDPFADSGDEAPKNAGPPAKRPKNTTSLGIDEAVDVNKKPRAPLVKLDETRLLSEKGIPRLRRKARDLRFKGKGHEFSDAARLLSFYQLWFDDLFPKASFLDAASMAEKVGHKKYMQTMRREWIGEGKPKPLADEFAEIFGDVPPEGDGQGQAERAPALFPARIAPMFQNQGRGAPRTPPPQPTDDDAGVPGDDAEDLYDATPRARGPPAAKSGNGASLFGSGAAGGGVPDDDEDDLDALMAEEEALRARPNPNQNSKSLFGDGDRGGPQEEDDLDALMAEAERDMQIEPAGRGSDVVAKPASTAAAGGGDGGDDLDALMAEVEAEPQDQGKAARDSVSSGPPKDPHDVVDADAEEAMAEMEGLW
ncbi:Swi3-domain-containing protein [Durotheca rogersii]|uniref:Swi3-domain-containing protein n=1 Tax=Durotheca rogersii TaxID=419775 RepID=UPI002220367D|nr:Swi3-domain-containing protein [Durotheca rogersii]KAI5861040.1 Swi3-domain-containing protein [Durotheca rogersii]